MPDDYDTVLDAMCERAEQLGETLALLRVALQILRTRLDIAVVELDAMQALQLQLKDLAG